MAMLIKGGTVVSTSGRRQLDVRIKDEKIIEMGCDLEVNEDKIIDASACYLFPGFIDGHTHLELENDLATTSDNFVTGSQAAVAKGTTTIIDMATPVRGSSLNNCLKTWNQMAEGKASCDFNYHMSLIEWTPAIKAEVSEMIAQGITSFKMYMAYDAMRASDAELFEAMKEIKKVGGILGVHCENGDVINQLQKDYLQTGKVVPKYHPLSRPNVLEAEAINRYLTIAGQVGLAVNIVHLSTKESLEVVKRARAKGQVVYVETCPQYLLLEDSLYDLPNFEGAKYVCSPPLRKPTDNKALWQGVIDGHVQTISTDHCDFNFSNQKINGKDDFTKIPGGMPGVETRPELIYTAGVMTEKISLERFVGLLSEDIAKQFNMYPKKGVIQIGSDADIVIWDPEQRDVISAKTQVTNCDYTPYEGFETIGKARDVFLRGDKVAENGKVCKEKIGKFVFRKINE
ncbi:dihydropyrimidinase [Tetragenococcus halophilus]|uniref:dihydropyrimidinase n=1 Tax=Tetragenococcus halophilus TaxID=51669 RepID=UPI000CB37588|nr:dihydropyrimidinase [Tetragenococcus halophilus]RQD29400.1 dihydropyrimidinase [Tetragenococcus halophilus subsp. halophilus DSM 20339]GBD59437.1 D-hydantoinase [Tetragenococcus halophilus subsp. halophilus]GMA45399.1 dihydropyrimidinase [Tetragenococcus halophilus subsp. halophilus DSM 20339]